MVNLAPMPASEFESFLERLVIEYAADKVRAGNWTPEESVARSRKDCLDLLPQGVDTPGHHLYLIHDDEIGADVGVIWLAEDSRRSAPTGFIYDLSVDERFRRRGYATRGMLALEDKARALGLETLQLHVFGFNHEARALYEKLGYGITNISMAKALK